MSPPKNGLWTVLVGGGRRGCRRDHPVRLGLVRLDCLTPTLREKASLHDLIKNSQNKNQVNFNCVKTKNLLEATKNKFICNCVKAVLGNKAAQNMFSCAFPIFWDLFQKLRICLWNEFFLGRRNLRRPRTIPYRGPENMPAPKTKFLLGRRNLRRPRLNSFLGAVTYGAQEEIFLGEKSKVFERCFKK